jgi:serine O-acetyltransferase
VKCFLWTPELKYSFLLRSALHLKELGLWVFWVYVVTRLLLNHFTYKYGISIPYNTSIGFGLYIGHFGGIVVVCQVKVGNNCNINHDVTIGTAYGGRYSEASLSSAAMPILAPAVGL